MIIKVCGLNDKINILQLKSEVGVKWIGLNFYPKSKRYVNNEIHELPDELIKVGVFVNTELSLLEHTVIKYNLNFVQLHGGESVDYCREAQKFCPIIKVFSVDKAFDFDLTKTFEFCDYFLFDTKCDEFGGSGIKFDWDKLNEYNGETPFLLAGGISIRDINEIKKIKHPLFLGVDINSRFELKPGLKDVEQVGHFYKEILDLK